MGAKGAMVSGPPKSQEDAQLKMFDDWVSRRDESLHPDLAPYLVRIPSLGRVLKHPLVFSVPFFSAGMSNDQYAYKQKALREALEAEDWHRVIFLHERPYRLEAFVEYVAGRDEDGALLPLVSYPGDSHVRDLAVSVWLDSENIYEHEDEWNELFAEWAPGDAPVIMDEEGAEAFEEFPDEVEVWRGCARDSGFSWSLDRDIAEFFMNRSSLPAHLLHARVPKDRVMGVVFGRGEREVLLRRDLIGGVETVS